jgi:hypothetical protein
MTTLEMAAALRLRTVLSRWLCDVQEYVVVLVSHGKQQSQAIVDLEAFLGDESTAFVTWYVCSC